MSEGRPLIWTISGKATADKGGPHLNGRRSIVKEGVKVRGVPSGLWRYLDMQDAIVDGETHKNDPCGQLLVKTKDSGPDEMAIPRKKPTVARTPA